MDPHAKPSPTATAAHVPAAGTAGEYLMTSTVIGRAFPVLCLALILVSAWRIRPPVPMLTDFHAFYLAGWLAGQGRLAEAYHATQLFAAQVEVYRGVMSFMPWTYPPPFNLVCEPLARLGLVPGYLLFSALGGLLYWWVIRRLAGPFHVGVLLLIAPSLILNLRSGQNGLWTGSLIGLWALASAQGRLGAGVALGAMVIKPHLAVGAALATLWSRRWAVLVVAGLTAAALAAMADLAYGRAIWGHFGAAVRESTIFMREGLYPFSRMTSVYATVRSFGLPASMALTVQLGSIAFGCLLILKAHAHGSSVRVRLGLSVLASLFFSPYLYDYDLGLLGVSLALVLKDFWRAASVREKLLTACLAWSTCGFGLAATALAEFSGATPTSTALTTQMLPTPAGLTMVLLAVVLWRVLERDAAKGSSAGVHQV